MHILVVGNHPSISLAEIIHAFPEGEIIACEHHLVAVENVSDERIEQVFPKLGGVIKVIRIDPLSGDVESIARYLMGSMVGKITFGLNIYGKSEHVLSRALEIKKKLKLLGRSSRCVNTNENNLTSATSIHNALIKNKTEINIIYLPKGKSVGITTHIQDIASYTHRDINKQRSMTIGMLPPKLAQILINLADIPENFTVFDPFVGFGTILIEAAYSGYTHLIGSDIQPELVKKAEENLHMLANNPDIGSRLAGLNSVFFSADATRLASQRDLDLTDIAIVTEGYLGKMFHPGNVHEREVQGEKTKLLDLYTKFLAELQKMQFRGTMVITIPFWQIRRGSVIYFDEFFHLLVNRRVEIVPLLPKQYVDRLTARGTLLYVREDQAVGREIYRCRLG